MSEADLQAELEYHRESTRLLMKIAGDCEFAFKHARRLNTDVAEIMRKYTETDIRRHLHAGHVQHYIGRHGGV